MTDFLDDKRREITARLNELGPLVDEYNRLTAAASALEGIGGASVAAAAAAPSRRGPGRPPGSSSKTATIATAAPAKKRGRPPGRPKKVGRPKTKKVGRPPGRPKAPAATAAPAASAAATTTTTGRRRAGRRKGSGTRAAQALRLVRGQPGITIPELAAKMGIKQNYLYRVLPGLEQDGKLEKKGRGWFPKEG
ncbi:MAG TPA: hypothetical protein VJ996_07055 [Solirubrobacteraceae bacterium]|nr:hypothetical protein [Solirubrobacteraceae bacterium]